MSIRFLSAMKRVGVTPEEEPQGGRVRAPLAHW